MSDPKEETGVPLEHTRPLETAKAEDADQAVPDAEAPTRKQDGGDGGDDAMENAECDQTIAFALKPTASSPGSHYYTPVILALFGEMKPERRVIEQEELFIGRSSACDLSLGDDAASRRHARLHYTNHGNNEARPLVHIYDMESRNGVYVNGQRVVKKLLLHDNARISIGETQLGYYVLSFPKKQISPDKTGEAKTGGAAGSGEDKPTAPMATPASAQPVAPAKRICVIDADFNFASDLRQQLDATERYHPVVYRNLDNAIRNFDVNPPQMILLDADLPEGDTADLCARLKGHEKWKGVPIILLFSKIDSDRVRAALKAGAQSYLKKPIDNLTLLTSRIDIHINVNAMMSSIGQGTRR
jgi:CheY-like chemotaxis protein